MHPSSSAYTRYPTFHPTLPTMQELLSRYAKNNIILISITDRITANIFGARSEDVADRIPDP